MTEIETYLESVASEARGAGAERLTVELRDHLEDAIAHEVAGGCDPADAVRVALERLGPADEVLAAWKARARARRAQDRRRAALVAFAAVTASALALVQHASGRQPTPTVPAVTCGSATLPFGGRPNGPLSLRPALSMIHAGSRRSGANPLRCT